MDLRHVIELRLEYEGKAVPFGLDMGTLYRALSVLIEDCGRAGFADEASALLRDARSRHDAIEKARRDVDASP